MTLPFCGQNLTYLKKFYTFFLFLLGRDHGRDHGGSGDPAGQREDLRQEAHNPPPPLHTQRSIQQTATHRHTQTRIQLAKFFLRD